MTKTKTTKRALFASVLSLLVCVSMLIGSTFAWFTDSATTGVNNIQAGTLDIDLIDAAGKSLVGQTLDFVKADEADDNEAILWEPGCTYSLPAVYVKNNGNLALKYKIVITGINGSAKLNEAIEWTVALNNAALAEEYHLAGGATSEALTISGHMKEEAGNEYQGLTIDGIAITVLATQDTVEYDSSNNTYDNNAPDLTDDDGNIIINDVVALFSFANKVNAGNNYSGKTVLLNADIDLAGIGWTPIGNVNSYPGVTFAGTFDGQNHTISNMSVTALGDNGYATAGFFGSITGKVQNLTIDNATVVSSHYAGGIVGYSSANVGMEIRNCKVTNSTITSTAELLADGSYDNGDKVGGIIGYMVAGDVVTGCTVENTTVTAYRDLGGIVGYGAGTITNNTVKNVTLVVDKAHNYKNYTSDDAYHANAVVGENAGATVENNAETGTKIGSINVVADQDGLNDVLANNNDTVVEVELPKGEYTLPSLTDKDATIVGNKDTVVEVEKGVYANGSTITFRGITVAGTNDESSFYTTQLNGAKKVIYEDCTITGLISTYCDSEFINCEFKNTFNDQYSVFCYGGSEFSFTNCKFDTNCSKAIKLYNESTSAKTLNVTNCTFTTTTADKAAVEIDSTYATEGYTVNLSGCVINGSYTKLYNDKSTNSTVTVK